VTRLLLGTNQVAYRNNRLVIARRPGKAAVSPDHFAMRGPYLRSARSRKARISSRFSFGCSPVAATTDDKPLPPLSILTSSPGIGGDRDVFIPLSRGMPPKGLAVPGEVGGLGGLAREQSI
jgi:hypothetical protein